VGEAVDGDGHLYERIRPAGVEAAFPRGERGDRDEKVTDGFGCGPASLDLEREDGEAEIGRIVRSGTRGETAEACAEDGGGSSTASAQASASPRCGRHEGPEGVTVVTCDAQGKVTAVTSPDGTTKTFKY
jgi:YD repeat-containing protein